MEKEIQKQKFLTILACTYVAVTSLVLGFFIGMLLMEAGFNPLSSIRAVL